VSETMYVGIAGRDLWDACFCCARCLVRGRVETIDERAEIYGVGGGRLGGSWAARCCVTVDAVSRLKEDERLGEKRREVGCTP
jgi:hypothetical protein